jgi:hypothetical protein
LGAGAVLVGSHDGRVEHHVFFIVIVPLRWGPPC